MVDDPTETAVGAEQDLHRRVEGHATCPVDPGQRLARIDLEHPGRETRGDDREQRERGARRVPADADVPRQQPDAQRDLVGRGSPRSS